MTETEEYKNLYNEVLNIMIKLKNKWYYKLFEFNKASLNIYLPFKYNKFS